MLNKVKVVCCSNREQNVERAVTVNYPCQYQYNGKIRMIDSFGTYREIKSSEVGYKDQDGNLHGHFPSIAQFTKTVMSIEYKYWDNEKDEDFDKEVDKNTKNIVELFWGKCPLCLANGTAHTAGQSGNHFDLIDSNIKTLTAVHSFKDKRRASNAIGDMTHAQRENVAFYYGISPIGKSEEELLVELGDSVSGYCMNGDNLTDFLKVWVDGKTTDRDQLVILKKAIGNRIITNKVADGRNAYYLGDTFLGSDDAGLIDWSRKNPRDYEEHIVRKVTEGDKKAQAEPKSLTANKVTKIDLNEFDKLKREAKSLIEEGFIDEKSNCLNMSYDKLKVVVDAALTKKNEVAA